MHDIKLAFDVYNSRKSFVVLLGGFSSVSYFSDGNRNEWLWEINCMRLLFSLLLLALISTCIPSSSKFNNLYRQRTVRKFFHLSNSLQKATLESFHASRQVSYLVDLFLSCQYVQTLNLMNCRRGTSWRTIFQSYRRRETRTRYRIGFSTVT